MSVSETTPYIYYSNKKKVYLLMKKIYRYVHDYGDIHLGKLKPEKFKGKTYNTMGLYHWGECRIELDYRFELIPTLIHECIHHCHPTWSEEKVAREEKMVMAIISKKQVANLIKALASVL